MTNDKMLRLSVQLLQQIARTAKNAAWNVIAKFRAPVPRSSESIHNGTKDDNEARINLCILLCEKPNWGNTASKHLKQPAFRIEVS